MFILHPKLKYFRCSCCPEIVTLDSDLIFLPRGILIHNTTVELVKKNGYKNERQK